MAKPTSPQPEIERPPVVAILGHIDHGKSTLLDYIRKTRIVESEAGGITQRLSAYEVEHKTKDGAVKHITFLDTPGHEAFARMRSQGLEVADIAILVVSAEDGVKAQTVEAVKAIRAANVPFVVAITKIDKSGANVEKAKSSLIENEIYLEGQGGDISYVPLSSKTGEGMDELLDMILLVAELAELRGDPSKPGTGLIIEANRDPKKGITATLIVKDGTLRSGMFVVAGSAFAPTRIMQDFMGKPVSEATFSSPLSVVGFSEVPETGMPFVTVASKKEAEEMVEAYTRNKKAGGQRIVTDTPGKPQVPIAIKADVAGALDAIKHEIKKIAVETVSFKVVHEGIGTITENDVQSVGAGKGGLVVGFNVKADGAAVELARRNVVEIGQFDIIYRLTEWLEVMLEERRPRQAVEVAKGSVKIIRVFGVEKDKQIVGGRVEDGEIAVGDKLSITRRGERIGTGEILGLQRAKATTKTVEAGVEFGAQVESKTLIAAGDVLESFVVEIK